jgi:hypothetical protein
MPPIATTTAIQTHLLSKLTKLDTLATFLYRDLPDSLAMDEQDWFILELAFWVTLYYLMGALLFVGGLWALVRGGVAVYRKLWWERKEVARCKEAGDERRPWPGVRGIIFGVGASGRWIGIDWIRLCAREL